MGKTLDGEQKYYECTECGASLSAGEIQAHELYDCSTPKAQLAQAKGGNE